MGLNSISSPNRNTLGKAAYTKIREEIITLNFKPGQMLSESELAAALGVSRTPIREAFLNLLQEELLEILPQRGARVALISVKKVEEARFVRESLEISAFKSVARNWDADDLRYKEIQAKAFELIEKQHKAALKGESIEFMQHDETFHQLFLELVENQTLISVVSQMRGHLNRMRYLELKTPNHMENVVSQHQTILKAVFSKNEEKTEKLLLHHFSHKQDELPKVIEKYSEYFTF
ncbi:GntR family transcriptional regulator [Bacillus sp. ISL-18]|uniref:GntR family transcriptional regulator n=1 Tax=Bacillus sp. ISL-18 TaxID=2819118 RepID=UPI001BE92157|nr:GntR family transcriptional regulator [Bacillus sp. ISL-18]MBT2655116.1 GntR family transcriptional regulator [Bacillus sp. ISL-18]